MEDVSIDTASTESVEQVETPIEDMPIDIDELSKDEFEEMLEEPEAAEDNTEADEEPKELTLDDLYKTQMEAPESQLDKPIFLKYNGSVHKVNSVKELKNLAEKGISHTAKSQELSSQTELMQRLEANGYTEEDLLQLATAHKGEELTQVDTNGSKVDAVATEIMNSSYKEEFTQVASQLPNDIQIELQRNPQMLQGFANDVESGLASHIMHEVKRSMDINGMNFHDAYVSAGKSYYDKQTTTDDKRKTLDSQPTKSIETPMTTEPDAWAMSKEEFQKYMDKV